MATILFPPYKPNFAFIFNLDISLCFVKNNGKIYNMRYRLF